MCRLVEPPLYLHVNISPSCIGGLEGLGGLKDVKSIMTKVAFF